MAQRQHLAQKQREAQLAAANSSLNMTNVSLGKEQKATIVMKTPTGSVPPNLNMKASHTGNAMNATMIEKKAESMLEAYKQNWDPVPPLAPLSGNRQTSIISSIPVPTVSPSKIDDDSNSTSQSSM